MPRQPKVDIGVMQEAYGRLGSMRAVAAELGIGATVVRKHLNRILKHQGKRSERPVATDRTGSAPPEVLAAEGGELG